MNLILSKKISVRKISKIIRRLLKLRLDKKKLILLDKEFNINSIEIISTLLNNIIIINDKSNYIVTFDSAVKYKGKPLNVWYNMITYGSLSVKGYPIFIEIADYIKNHLSEVSVLGN